MKSKQEWIDLLQLDPHIEGGYFKQIDKSEKEVGPDNRSLYTSIYFLLAADNPSRFHRLTCDEVWYFHAGQALSIHMITPQGQYQHVQLGLDVEKGQQLSYCVEAGTIFGSTVEEDYALVSCLCAPGFEYEDFELFKKDDLLRAYPDHEAIIQRLT